MGKSDPYVFRYYLETLYKTINQNKIKNIENCAFFGFSKSNTLTNAINFKNKKYFDLELCNWNINDYPYQVNEKFDLIICTRVAYFCKQPKKLLSEFYKILNDEGIILIDWGMGDHWRFKEFKIGWVKNNEHEYAYHDDNFLWSGFYDKKIMKNCPHYIKFLECCKSKKGYKDPQVSIIKEFPKLIELEDFETCGYQILNIENLFLWPDNPQLYTTIIAKKHEGG